jgi:hypothetical protein
MLGFYKDKKVFITGHTGFKGTWLCNVLIQAGAEVTGYALESPTTQSLFGLTGSANRIHSIIGDVRDREMLVNAMVEAKPDIVFHLAAQPLVRLSYREPALTYETNVMGTVNVLEALRQTPSVRSFVNVTTDKVYENNTQISEWRYYLDRLYDQVENDWLADYRKNGSIQCSYSTKTIFEEFSGDYDVKCLNIIFRNQKIYFDPLGTMLIGAKGRVDVLGKNGKASLILVDSDLNAPRADVRIFTSENERKEYEKQRVKTTPKKIVWTWKIFIRNSSIKYITLDEERFFDMLMGLVDG